MRYRSEVDGLRAIAVLSVIFYHAELVIFGRDWFQGGYIGVDIFFVISGYLITRIILSELFEQGAFCFSKFYARRARRILPVLFTVMLVSFPFAWNYLLPGGFVEYCNSILSAVFFSSNFFFYFATTEYGADSALLKPFLHTWSLGIEEQFYIVFPILLLLFHKFLKNHLLTLFSGMLLLSLLFSEVMSVRNADLNFFLPMSRFWELLAGSVLAYLELKHGRLKHALANQILPVIGLSLITCSILLFNAKTAHPGLITMAPVIGVSLIIAFSSRDDLVGKILSSKPFVGVGLISYSAYLWHFPIFAFSRIKDSTPSEYDKLEWIILTFVLSLISYFVIEKPFRNKKTIPRKWLIPFILSMLAVLLTACILVVRNDGYPSRMNIDYSANKNLVYPRGAIFSKDADANENSIILILGDSFVTGDDYENETLRTGNWTTLIRHIDLEKNSVVALSYLMCDLALEKEEVDLVAVQRGKNQLDCQKLVDTLNSDDVRKRIGHIILASHRPFYTQREKFRLIEHIAKSSEMNPDVYVLGNYTNLEYKKQPACEALMRESESSAIACLRENLDRNIDLHSRPYDLRPTFPQYLSDKIKYIDLHKVLVGDNWLELEEEDLIERMPHTIKGMPFILDTHHNTSVFIDHFGEKLKDYQGEDEHIMEFQDLLK